MKHTALVAAIALAPFAFAPVASGATYFPLFDAVNITASGFPTDITQKFYFASTKVTTYCFAGGIAQVVTDDGDGTYSFPIVDNYITAGNDLMSICDGGWSMAAWGIGGDNCFDGTKDGIPLGGLAVDHYTDAPGNGTITASVTLPAGTYQTEFKLWDFGDVYANSKLVLQLPEGCTVPPPGPAQWCSPGYWRNHADVWAAYADTLYTGTTTYSTTKKACTGEPATPSYLELLNKPQCYGGDAFNAVADRLSALMGLAFTGERVDACPLN